VQKETREQTPEGLIPVFRSPTLGERINAWLNRGPLTEKEQAHVHEQWCSRESKKKFKDVNGLKLRVDGFYMHLYETIRDSAYCLCEKRGKDVQVLWIPYKKAAWLVKAGLLSRKSYKQDGKDIEELLKRQAESRGGVQ
jgi:hypothetical protein